MDADEDLAGPGDGVGDGLQPQVAGGSEGSQNDGFMGCLLRGSADQAVAQTVGVDAADGAPGAGGIRRGGDRQQGGLGLEREARALGDVVCAGPGVAAEEPGALPPSEKTPRSVSSTGAAADVAGGGHLHLGRRGCAGTGGRRRSPAGHPAAQGRGAGHAGKLGGRPLQRAGGREVRVARAVHLGGAEEDGVDAAAAGVIEQVGDRHLAGAAVEIAEVLGAGVELRNLRIEERRRRRDRSSGEHGWPWPRRWRGWRAARPHPSPPRRRPRSRAPWRRRRSPRPWRPPASAHAASRARSAWRREARMTPPGTRPPAPARRGRDSAPDDRRPRDRGRSSRWGRPPAAPRPRRSTMEAGNGDMGDARHPLLDRGHARGGRRRPAARRWWDLRCKGCHSPSPARAWMSATSGWNARSTATDSPVKGSITRGSGSSRETAEASASGTGRKGRPMAAARKRCTTR